MGNEIDLELGGMGKLVCPFPSADCTGKPLLATRNPIRHGPDGTRKIDACDAVPKRCDGCIQSSNTVYHQ
jgi:hypothetical protein